METPEFAVWLGAVWAEGLLWRKAPLPKYTFVTTRSASSLEESTVSCFFQAEGFA